MGLQLGCRIFEVARDFADQMSRSTFVTSLRNGTVQRSQYMRFIGYMYPIVVTFNRALIRSMSKLDNVHDRRTLAHLVEQVREEQGHNEMYRHMLEVHGIDHGRIYDSFRRYMSKFDEHELDLATRSFISDLRRNSHCERFLNRELPQPVLGLCHLLLMTSSRSSATFWEHFASQTAIEYVIYQVVSSSVYPGVLSRSDLNLGPASIEWWSEHCDDKSARGGRPNDEERHLRVARALLDRYSDPTAFNQILESARDAIELFSACVDEASFGFDSYGAPSTVSQTGAA
jgi:hypothetical protein